MVMFFSFDVSLKSDTKWLSWLAYQFHTAVGKRRSLTSNGIPFDDSMDLETFKNSFYFKVVRTTSLNTIEILWRFLFLARTS